MDFRLTFDSWGISMDASDIQRLIDLDHAHVWHPFTQMRGWLEESPLIIDRGQDEFIYDIHGKEYIDGISSLWVTVHGHNRPEINSAIKAQVDKICHSTLLGQASRPSIEVAAYLSTIAPGDMPYTFYSDAGSTATEIGLKIAYQYQQQTNNKQRNKFAALNLAYHGDTIGAVSVGGMDLFHGVYRDLLFDAVRLPAPYCYRCELGLERATCDLACAAKAEEILDQEGETLAGLIIEPLVQGAAGIVTHPDGYLRRVFEACRRNNILFIADEVAVGLGRTGKMFACEWENVTPDILCLGKGLSGGYLPLAATMTTRKVFDGFLGKYEEFKTFFHGHTFTGNPVACAAALASLNLYNTDRTLETLQSKIEKFSDLLSELKSLKHVGEVRQRGFMAGVELVSDRSTKEPFPPEELVPHRVIMHAREQGVVIRPLGNVIVLMPILAVRPENLNRIVEVTGDSIKKITEG
jgi:adenosylmethionine-8-amino-7-oxononanoate aminotransferase